MGRTPALLPALATVLLLVGDVCPAHAQVSEAAVKAAFLPKIARYVEWPSRAMAAGGSLQLCIVGADPFGRLMDEAVVGQTVADRPVVVRRMNGGEQVAGCHVAFLRGPTALRALPSLRGRPVLTVTDSRDGQARGMVHFARKGERVSFHIDDVLAREAGLSISSRLLAIALSVRTRPS
jgi:hypothetical protein